MAITFRLGRSLAGAVLITAGLLALSGCHKRPAAQVAAAPATPPPPPPPPPPRPEPFTGTLTQIDGVEALISLRHPKLINQDLEKLMTAVPEVALLRPMLEQLAPFGYPEFSEIAPGSNIGIALVKMDARSGRQPAYVIFAKLKAGGKIASLLSQQGSVMQKQGEWTLVAQDADSIAKVSSNKSIEAYLETPQAEDLRVWAGVTPELIGAIKNGLKSQFMAGAMDSLRDAKRNATLAYIDAGLSLLSQLHSIEAGLSLGNTGIRLKEAYQFNPDSPAGTYFRYKVGPAPAVAGEIAANGVAAGYFRAQPKALNDWMDSIFDTFIAVDYPAGAARLKSFKTMEEAYMATVEGAAGVLDLETVQKDGQERLKPRFFYVSESHISSESAREYFSKMDSLSQHLLRLNQSALAMQSLNGIQSHVTFRVNALTVDGVAFDSERVSTTLNGREVSGMTEYFGDAGGKIVVADSQTTLEQRLPALLAGKPLPDGISVPDRPTESARIEVYGAKLVDALAQAAKLNQADPDVRAQIDSLKAEYNGGKRPSLTIDDAQARAEVAINVPYKFISATVHLSAYLTAQKFDLRQLFMPAMPIRPQHRRAHSLQYQAPADPSAPAN